MHGQNRVQTLQDNECCLLHRLIAILRIQISNIQYNVQSNIQHNVQSNIQYNVKYTIQYPIQHHTIEHTIQHSSILGRE